MLYIYLVMNSKKAFYGNKIFVIYIIICFHRLFDAFLRLYLEKYSYRYVPLAYESLDLLRWKVANIVGNEDTYELC